MDGRNTIRSGKSLELKVPPVAVFLICGAVMWLAAGTIPAARFSVPGATVIAVVLAAIGAGLGVSAILAFRRSKTTVHPIHLEKASSIVTGGVYRLTRNPMYLALALLLTAWSVKLGNLVSLACIPVFVAYMTRFQIKPEERSLLSSFGAPYGDYMKSVRRWL